MFAAILAGLSEQLVGKVSLQTLKWVAGGVLLLTVALVSGMVGYRWELATFDEYKAKAAAHELKLQQSYDAIGGEAAKEYIEAVTKSRDETRRQLEALQNAPPIPAPPALSKAKRFHKPSAPVAGDPDTERTLRVLRDAFAGSQ